MSRYHIGDTFEITIKEVIDTRTLGYVNNGDENYIYKIDCPPILIDAETLDFLTQTTPPAADYCVDWTKVPVDTPVQVKFYHEAEWQNAYFAKYEGGEVYVWGDGRTSWTAEEWYEPCVEAKLWRVKGYVF